MKKSGFFAVLLSLSLASVNAWSMDHRSQFGVGGALGANIPAPWGSTDFKNATSTKVPAASAWARYIFGTPEVSLELSYNYIALGTMNFSGNAGILSFVSRQNPWGSFHPFYGFGVGYVATTNKFPTTAATASAAPADNGTWSDPIFKITAGIEFEMNDRMDVGLRIDHYTIFRDTNDQRAIHDLAPAVSINYYFGTPAPLPAAEGTKPAPAPTPAATAPAPAPAKTVEAPAPAPEKSASKNAVAKTAKKKPAKKKKKKAKVKPDTSDTTNN
jgi:hypothetical protein